MHSILKVAGQEKSKKEKIPASHRIAFFPVFIEDRQYFLSSEHFTRSDPQTSLLRQDRDTEHVSCGCQKNQHKKIEFWKLI